jgi:type IV fimbrial biogenesis protein FimT
MSRNFPIRGRAARFAQASLDMVATMRMRNRMSGFSMVELLVVIGIAAILMSIAVPSYQSVTTSNRISSEVNSLLGDMQFARYEAIKEGQTITVCPSTDGATCSLTNVWNTGWIVQTTDLSSGTKYTLRYQRAFSPSGDSFTSNDGVQSMAFNREGFASGLTVSTVTFALHDATNTGAYTRCLAVGISGMLTTQLNGQTTGSGQVCS